MARNDEKEREVKTRYMNIYIQDRGFEKLIEILTLPAKEKMELICKNGGHARTCVRASHMYIRTCLLITVHYALILYLSCYYCILESLQISKHALEIMKVS